MRKILYIHGYNGSPQGRSFRLFQKYMSAYDGQVIGMDYTQDDCAIALQEIRETIEREHIDLVIGSSLGGFLALLTTGIPRIVINPCYSPSAELPKLGPHNGLPAPSKEMVDTYAAFEPRLKSFTDEERQLVTGYFAEDDELLGDTYREMFEREISKPYTIPGGHHVAEEAVSEICFNLSPRFEYLKRAHKASFKNEESILHSQRCGCFNCQATFPASEVILMEEMDGQKTAWCPRCGIDAVLGDASGFPISEEFLEEMRKTWFG